MNLGTKLIFSIIVLIWAHLITYPAFAENSEDFHPCKISKKTINNYEPASFGKTNNLLRNTGQRADFMGKRIIIYGRVIDQNCQPVSDAKIYGWQVDNLGFYPYKTLRDEGVIDSKYIQLNDSSSFVGSGIATTNNYGEFHFVTIYPKSVHEIKPHVNIRVEHRKFGSFQTQLMLPSPELDDSSKSQYYKILDKISYEMGAIIHAYTITIPGESDDYLK